MCRIVCLVISSVLQCVAAKCNRVYWFCTLMWNSRYTAKCNRVYCFCTCALRCEYARLCAKSVAVCCSVLQCVAVCCSVLQCVALYCSQVQHTATHCNTLSTQSCILTMSCACTEAIRRVQQSVLVGYFLITWWVCGMVSLVCCSVLQCVAVRWGVLQCVACSVLQYVAAKCCSVLQCVATKCNRVYCFCTFTWLSEFTDLCV